MKFECVHVDTCLTDYWGGHHLLHVCFPARSGMTLNEVKEELKSEVDSGAISGGYEYREDSGDIDEPTYEAMVEAIDAIELRKGYTTCFSELEEDEDEAWDCAYAYFVFVPQE